MAKVFTGEVERYGRPSRKNLTTEGKTGFFSALFGKGERIKPSEVRERHLRFILKLRNLADSKGWENSSELSLGPTEVKFEGDIKRKNSVKQLRGLESIDSGNLENVDNIHTSNLENYGPVEKVKFVYRDGGSGKYGTQEQYGAKVELSGAEPATTDEIIDIMEEEYGRHDEELYRFMPDPAF